MNIKKIAKFLVSGSTAALCEYLLFLALGHLVGTEGYGLIISQSLSFCAGLIVSFVLNKIWVFSAIGDTHKMFAKYVVLAAINLLLSNIALLLLSKIIAAYIAKFIVMVFIAAWNYLLFSKIIFKSKV